VEHLDELKPLCWGFLQAQPFVYPTTGKCTALIHSNDEGVFDLDEIACSDSSINQRYVLKTHVHCPRACEGSLHLDNTRPTPVTGQWPMALVNNFYGYRRADEDFTKRKQPIAIYVNGKKQTRWGRHCPLLNGIPWQKGWNELTILLDAQAGRAHRFKLTASTHHWNTHSKTGLTAHPGKQLPANMPDVDDGLVIKTFAYELCGEVDGQSVYINLPQGQSPDQMQIRASQIPCLLTHDNEPCEHVVLRNLCFERATANPKFAMLDLLQQASHWSIENCHFKHTTGGCINIENGSRHSIQSCSFDHVGCTAIQAWATQHQRVEELTIRDCQFSRCNQRGFGLGWHGACVKICRGSHCLIEQCAMSDSDAHGIWLDWECETNDITHNRMDHCTCSGIFLEASRWNNRVTHNHISHTQVGPFGGNGIYMHDTSDSYIAHNILEHNVDFGLRMGLATNRKLEYGIAIRRSGNVIVHNVMRHNGQAAMDVPQELPGKTGNHYDHNVYFPARFVLVDPQDKDKLFNAQTGKSPEIRRYKVTRLSELQTMTGQDQSSTDQLPDA
ncbi:MAG: right-handed parallel beta-helix repeat-containing protein, partial [Phycisphaeraceae bacterium JB051]